MAAEREKPMPEAEVNAWLQKNLPKWRLEDGWIRRTYKTSGLEGHADGDQYGRPPGRGRVAPS